MTTENKNAVAVQAAEQNKVTKQLCLEYIKSQNTDLTEGEFAQYAAVATTLNLNPFLREIYPIKYNGKMTLVTGYQVYIRRAEEFPQYDGFDTQFEGAGKDLCCICNVYRKDRTRPVTARVYFAEYTQNNSMWNGKPHVMLEKVAIGTAFRRAFPTEFGGMPYTSEEIRAEDELKAQGYTEVQQAAPVAQPEQPKAAKTQDEKDANWKKMCDEIREKNPEAFDAFLEKVALKSVMDVKTTAGRSKLLADLNEAVKAASATEKETV
jgi:phage recombination protein Bet